MQIFHVFLCPLNNHQISNFCLKFLICDLFFWGGGEGLRKNHAVPQGGQAENHAKPQWGRGGQKIPKTEPPILPRDIKIEMKLH